jgi:hypothetical protein
MRKGPVTIVICSIDESFGRDGSALNPRRADDARLRIRGLRITVYDALEYLAAGMSEAATSPRGFALRFTERQ